MDQLDAKLLTGLIESGDRCSMSQEMIGLFNRAIGEEAATRPDRIVPSTMLFCPVMSSLLRLAERINPVLPDLLLVHCNLAVHEEVLRATGYHATASVVDLVSYGFRASAVIGVKVYRRNRVIAMARLILTSSSRGNGLKRLAVPPERSASELAWERTVVVPSEAGIDFGRAVGDHNPIHKDPVLARAAGFDDVIVQGMCTFSILWLQSQLFADAMGFGSVQRMNGTFVRPVSPGSNLAIGIHSTESSDASIVASVGGRSVIRDGKVHFNSPRASLGNAERQM